MKVSELPYKRVTLEEVASVMEDIIREGAVPIPPSQEEKPDSQK